MKTPYTPLLLILFGLVGCVSQVPPSQNYYPSVPQQKIQAADHWNTLAANVAERLKVALSGLETAGGPLVLHVQQPTYGIFNAAFHELLVTQLLAHGFGVSDDPAVGLPVTYDVELISYNERDYPNIFAGPAPNKEIILNISVTSGDRYLTRISDIYYINENDYTLYLAQAPQTRRMELVGP